MYTEIKAYGLTKATFSDITLPGSESFINRGAKLRRRCVILSCVLWYRVNYKLNTCAET